MERRQWGALLLAAAVLAVLISAGLEPRRITGVPLTLSVPGPPAVGECVPDPVDPSRWGIIPYVYPELPFEACDGFRFGEVIAVLAHPAEPPARTGGPRTGPVLDTNPETCLDDSSRYAGTDPEYLYWSPRIYAFAVPVSPSPLQQAVGQHWVACAMFIPANDTQTAVVHYSGSLRNAMFTGNSRDVLGFCGSGPDWTTGYVDSCSSPHQFQVLASSLARARGATPEELQQTCVQVAHRLTALRDVTAAGALAVGVQIIDNGVGSTDSTDGSVPGHLGCGISTIGDRRLAGGLVAIGDLPVPWAG